MSINVRTCKGWNWCNNDYRGPRKPHLRRRAWNHHSGRNLTGRMKTLVTLNFHFHDYPEKIGCLRGCRFHADCGCTGKKGILLQLRGRCQWCPCSEAGKYRSGNGVRNRCGERYLIHGLTDDTFSSIVAGVEEGRVAYDNIRKVTLLLISTGLRNYPVHTCPFSRFTNTSARSPAPLVESCYEWDSGGGSGFWSRWTRCDVQKTERTRRRDL